MLLLNSIVLVDLHLTYNGYYLDYNYESMLWETINYLKEDFIPNHYNHKEFMKTSVKIYAALIPELHVSGYLAQNFLSMDFELINKNRETIESAFENFYLDVLDDSIGKWGNWEDIGHSSGRSMEWCKRNYDKDIIEQYQEYLDTWNNLQIAMKETKGVL